MEEQRGIALTSAIHVSRLISAFYYDFPTDFDYDGERHPGWEFVYVERGKVCVTADHMSYLLKSGELVCHKPMEFHKIRPYQGTASVIIFCFECQAESMRYFNNRILAVSQRQKYFLNDIAELGKHLFSPKAPLDIARDGTMDRLPYATALDEQCMKNTMELLLMSLMGSESTRRQEIAESYEQLARRRTLTADIIRYLKEHMEEPVRLSDITERFSYSASSIKRIFKQETGYSVIDYRNQLRVEQAKIDLKEKNDSIEQIAQGLGYANVYYFSNAFKKRTGQSPSTYRNRED